MEYTNIAVGSANGWVASVSTYSDLPDPVIHNGETYLVIKNQGIPILNFKSKGLWYAETGAWSYLGSVPDMLKDDTFRVINSTDITKQVAFDVSAVTSGQNRIVTIPDESGTLALQAYVNAKIPTGVNNNVLLSDGAGNAKDSGKAIGHASGNVPVADGTKCENLVSAASYAGNINFLNPLAWVQLQLIDGTYSARFQYRADWNSMPTADVDNWEFLVVSSEHTGYALGQIRVTAWKINSPGDRDTWENRCKDGAWGGWTKLTGAKGDAMFSRSTRLRRYDSGDFKTIVLSDTAAEGCEFLMTGTVTNVPFAGSWHVKQMSWSTDYPNFIKRFTAKAMGAGNFSEYEITYDYGTNAWSAWVQKTDASGNAVFPSVATTANAANAYIGANGTTILKSTSSKRYKTDIRDLDDSSTLDQLRPVLYKSNPETVPSDDPTLDHYGFIAEDIDEFDNKLVQYIVNDAGEKVPDGVQYDRITVLLVKRIQELEDRLTKAGIK